MSASMAPFRLVFAIICAFEFFTLPCMAASAQCRFGGHSGVECNEHRTVKSTSAVKPSLHNPKCGFSGPDVLDCEEQRPSTLTKETPPARYFGAHATTVVQYTKSPTNPVSVDVPSIVAATQSVDDADAIKTVMAAAAAGLGTAALLELANSLGLSATVTRNILDTIEKNRLNHDKDPEDLDTKSPATQRISRTKVSVSQSSQITSSDWDSRSATTASTVTSSGLNSTATSCPPFVYPNDPIEKMEDGLISDHKYEFHESAFRYGSQQESAKRAFNSWSEINGCNFPSGKTVERPLYRSFGQFKLLGYPSNDQDRLGRQVYDNCAKFYVAFRECSFFHWLHTEDRRSSEQSIDHVCMYSSSIDNRSNC